MIVYFNFYTPTLSHFIFQMPFFEKPWNIFIIQRNKKASQGLKTAQQLVKRKQHNLIFII